MKRVVLVIDDSESDQIAYGRALRDSDWLVTAVSTLAEGAAAFEQRKPDVILLDYNLPDGDGVSFLKKLVQDGSGTCPPIIMMTGSGDEHVAVDAIKSGASDYFVKDVSGSHLKLLDWAIQRVLAEHTLRLEKIKAAQRLRLAANVYNNITEGILVANPDGTIVSVNPAHCRMTGYSEAELLGKNPRLVKSDRHAPTFFQDMWNCIRQDGYWRGEIWNRRKDGSLYLCKETITAIRDDEGILQQYVAVSVDITETKRAQSALEQQTQLLEDVVNSVPYGLVVYDENHFLRFNNQCFVDILGLPTALLAKEKLNFTELVAYLYQRGDYGQQQPLSEVETRFVGVLEQGKSLTLERQQADGTFIEMQAIPLPNGWMVTTYLDVTARRMEQRSLAESKERMQLAIESSGAGIWEIDIVTGSLKWDAQQYRIYGLEPRPDDLTYAFWASQVLPEDLVVTEAKFREAVQSGTLFESTFRITLPTGELRYIQALGRSRRNEDGAVVYMIGINRDVTAEETYAESLKQARNVARDAALAKSLFLANMSHEIRTPMNAILGLIQLLGNTALTANQFDYVEKIEGSAKSLLGLLNDILDFSKIEAGKLDLELRPFRIDRFMRELSVLLSNYVGNKKVDVLFDIDPKIPVSLIGDPLRLKQVLINLGGNAIKFTQVGQVVFSLTLLDLLPVGSAGAQEARIVFSVADSGIGIAPENIPKLFSSFSQAEASTTRKFGGTGLGLAISKLLVELMGGTIELRSELHVGTTFSFQLRMPLDPAVGTTSQAQECLAPVARAHSAAHRVLLVDDNPIACNLMSKMMHGFGWSVDTARTGEAAVRQFRARPSQTGVPYSLVYVDWQLPGMDGWETIDQLRRICDMERLPPPKYIIVSANGKDALDLRPLNEQALINDFLVKPVTGSMVYNASLDRRPSEQAVRRSARANSRVLAGVKILVVEDNAINQQVAEELLNSQGAVVSIAADGEIAVNALAAAKTPYDIVLMDIQMPVMDGFEATQIIRQNLGLQTLPIIGLTANAMESDRDECLRAGMNEHLGKPFDLAQLVAMVIRLTGHTPVHPEPSPSPSPSPSPNADTNTPPGSRMTPPVDTPLTDVVDAAGALSRMGGNTRLYLRAASDLLLVLSTAAHTFTNAAKAGNRKQCAMLLHTLKGNCATLGLTHLTALVTKMELLCKEETTFATCAGHIQDLEQAVAEASRGLEHAMQALQDRNDGVPEDPQPGPLAPTPDRLNAAIQRLIPLLEAENFSALDVFNEERSHLELLPPAVFCELEAALQQLNWVGGLSLLEKLDAAQ